MAYSGLPSKACANCRARRIKCNLLEPACSQCRRAGKICPGYRDELSLIFRDENAKVIRKAQGRPPPAEKRRVPRVKGAEALSSRRGSTSHSSSDNDIGSHPRRLSSAAAEKACTAQASFINRHAVAISTASVPAPLTTPIESIGIRFFYHNYLDIQLTLPSSPTSTSTPHASSNPPDLSLDLAALPFWRLVGHHKYFTDAVVSVGLAGLANVRKEQGLMVVAHGKYTDTLRRVAGSLKNPEGADLGATLRAVMMLALFELVNTNPESPASWGVHLSGAVALLSSKRFEGLEQDAMESRLKMQFVFAMFINCIHRNEPLPPLITIWARVWGSSLPPPDAPAATLAGIVIRYVDFIYKIGTGDISSRKVILTTARDLDVELAAWEAELPPLWAYTVERAPAAHNGQNDAPGPGPFMGLIHRYSNAWIQRIWDHYRWVRILLHELILTHSAGAAAAATAPIQYASTQTQTTQGRTPSPPMTASLSTPNLPPKQSGPSASMFEHSSATNGTAPPEPSPAPIDSLSLISELANAAITSIGTHIYSRIPPSSPVEAPASTPRPTPGIFQVLWSLKVAGGAVGTSHELFEWVVRTLRDIGSRLGIRQAGMVVLFVGGKRAGWMMMTGGGGVPGGGGGMGGIVGGGGVFESHVGYAERVGKVVAEAEAAARKGRQGMAFGNGSRGIVPNAEGVMAGAGTRLVDDQQNWPSSAMVDSRPYAVGRGGDVDAQGVWRDAAEKQQNGTGWEGQQYEGGVYGRVGEEDELCGLVSDDVD